MVWMYIPTMEIVMTEQTQNIPEGALTALMDGLVIDCERRIRDSKTYHFLSSSIDGKSIY